MRTKIPSYTGDYRVVSLALDEKTKQDLIDENVDFIYVTSDDIVIYPEEGVLTDDVKIVDRLLECNNYDVFEIYEDGTVFRCYDDRSSENLLFITGRCNSNCIMCPSPENNRRNGNTASIDDLIMIASHIPSDASHITVTGGEPFLVGKDLFRLLAYCKEKFIGTEFQILTNGRVFALEDYCKDLAESIPFNTSIGIPLHGSCAEIHDAITQTNNSFAQTITGLKRLIGIGIKVEIRIVVSRLNVKNLSEIADLIVWKLSRVHHVSIMAMEMTGSAYINREKVWIPYGESFLYVKPAIEKLIQNGIDVRLYNYPLCVVDKDYQMICSKSISSWKVRYAEECEACKLKESCGGVFAGTLLLENEELKAVV